MTPPGPWHCPLRIGFLFPHGCQRLTSIGCPDCQNGMVADPYQGQDRQGYTSYDDYDDSYYYIGGYSGYHGYSGGGDSGGGGGGDSGGAGASSDFDGSMDFTEADGADTVQSDGQFESDMTES